MVLTQKQKEDLNKAILDYLRQSGYKQTSEIFEQEGGVILEQSLENILEKKWVSIVRLQKSVMDLEQQIVQLKSEGQSFSKNNLRSLLGVENLEELVSLKIPARHTLSSHRSNVTCVAFHPKFQLLGSGSEDGSIKLWDTDQGTLEKTLKGHLNFVNCLEFSQDEKDQQLVSGSSDMTVKIWDLSSFQCIRTLNGHEHTVSAVKFFQNDFIFSASRDCTIKQWEISTGYCKKTFHQHEKWVHCFDINHSNSILASGSADQTIIVWNIDKGVPQMHLKGTHTHVIECVKFLSPRHAEKLQAQINNPDKKKNIPEKNTNQQHHEFLLSAGRDKIIVLWNLTTQENLFTLQGHDNWIKDIALHPNGINFYSCSDDKTIRTWDILSAKEIQKITECHQNFISTIAINPKTMILATGSYDFNIKIWELR